MPSMVFISHSSKDRETADAICAHLESAGINCWIAPRDIEPGATWTKGIMQGLDACRVLILVFSEHANDSDHVQREVAKAFSSGLAEVFRSSRRLCQIVPTVRLREIAARLAPSSQLRLMTATKLEAGTMSISGPLSSPFS